ncbi:MAG: hypothetical protein Q9184_001813 [Pyrenodesmia sp. 2 TL-2023]
MEKPFSSLGPPTFEIYEDPVEAFFDQAQLNKPLPPTPRTPRRPSSAYSVGREDRNNLLPASIYLAPTQYRSSTSRLPDPTPIRPRLTRDAQTHVPADSAVLRPQVWEQQPAITTGRPNLRPDLSLDSLSISASQRSAIKTTNAVQDDSAQRHAETYTSILHAPSPTSPLPLPERYLEQQLAPIPMSGRITDVVDQSLVPSPLRVTSSFEEYERPPSRFSDSSSDAERHHDGIRKSIRGIAHKAFHSRKESKDTDDTDWSAFTRFQERTSSTPRRQSRVGSFVGHRRTSIQHSISGMYDTLTSLTTPSKPVKPTPVATTAPVKLHKPRIKSPAIPLTPYQEMGPRAWETASRASKKTSKSDKTRSDGASHLSLPTKDRKAQVQFNTPIYTAPLPADKSPKPRSMVNKLASAFSSGTNQVESAVGLNTARVKRTKSEKKREELKRKIKIIGLGDASTEKTEGHWI